MKVRNEYANLILFISFNAAYTLYMTKHLPRSAYLALLGLYCLVQIPEIIKGIIYRRRFVRLRELLEAWSVALLFFLISIVIQIMNGCYRSYLLEELLYFIIPVFIAFSAINYGGEKQVQRYLNIILIRMIAHFFLAKGSNLSLSAIMSITIFDSGSSVFEMVLAHDFLFMTVIWAWMGKFWRTTASAVLCILCFKRLPFLLVIVVYALYLMQRAGRSIMHSRIDHLQYYLSRPLEKSKGIVVWLFLLSLPLVMLWVYSDSGVSVIEEMFSINLNKFTSGRVALVDYGLKNCFFNGLGSVTDFYEKGFRNTNMHCDVIRLVKEVTFAGYAFYAAIMLRIFRKRRILFIMLMYLWCEMTISHMATNMNIWMILYLFAFLLYNEDSEQNTITAEGE